MQITTTFSPGDKGWVFLGDEAELLTVGQVRVKVTDSPGMDDESRFSNYMPQRAYEEVYMCVETGIDSGSLYTLGENIFTTKEACENAAHAVINQ